MERIGIRACRWLGTTQLRMDFSATWWIEGSAEGVAKMFDPLHFEEVMDFAATGFGFDEFGFTQFAEVPRARRLGKREKVDQAATSRTRVIE